MSKNEKLLFFGKLHIFETYKTYMKGIRIHKGSVEKIPRIAYGKKKLDYKYVKMI
jgi:hypothetical protein